MTVSGLSKKTRIFAGILALLTLFVILFSSFFIAFEAHHDCSGDDDCVICVCMEECEKILMQVRHGFRPVSCPAMAVFVLLLIVAAFRYVSFFPQDTLVSKKIRLND